MTILVALLLLVFITASIVCAVKKLKNRRDLIAGNPPYARLQQ
jgi:hypothetical protein